jgi:hypothetical protein
MPLNSINFNQQPVDMGYQDMLGNILKGYSAYLQPEAARQEVEGAGLNNALKQIQLQYAPQTAEANIANLQRQAQFGGYTGAAQEALSLEMLKRQYGEDHPVYQNALNAYQLGQQNTRSNIDTRGALNQYRGWNSLNQAAKENTLSAGRGIAPQLTDKQLVDFYAQGGSNEQLGEMVGKSPQEVAEAERRYAATNSTISNLQQGEGALAEEEVLSKFITPALAKYSGTWFGYSPSQVMDAFKSDKVSEDDQAEFLAARALAAEQAAIRARLANASNAQEALRDLKASSLNEFKIFQPFINPSVYAKTQRNIDRELGNAARARFAVSRGKTVDEAVGSSASQTITIRNPKTGEIEKVNRKDFERFNRK